LGGDEEEAKGELWRKNNNFDLSLSRECHLEAKIPMLQRMLPPAGQFSDDPSLEEDTSGKEIDR